MVPAAAVAAVAAAACAPVAWPLLAGGAAAAALAAAFGQVGGVGGGLLAEAVTRAWDRSWARRRGTGQRELREALAAELSEALTSPSSAAAGLRAEVAGVLQGVDAVRVALTTTIETTARESGDQVRAVLISGLRELGTQFTEFGWLLEEVNDQITRIAETQAEIAAGSRAMLEAQQRTLMQLTILRQQARAAAGRSRRGTSRPGMPLPGAGNVRADRCRPLLRPRAGDRSPAHPAGRAAHPAGTADGPRPVRLREVLTAAGRPAARDRGRRAAGAGDPRRGRWTC